MRSQIRTNKDATRGREKRKNNPTLKITHKVKEETQVGKGKAYEQPNHKITKNEIHRHRMEIDAPRTNQQPRGKRWWTCVIRTKQNKPETTWETLVDVCKREEMMREGATTRNRMGDTGGAEVGEKN